MSHSHHHEAPNYNKAFAIGILLNLSFVLVEAGYGIIAESLALLADAGHNLSDVLSLFLGWGASLLSKKSATEKRTFGFRKITIMASFTSGVLLLLTIGGIGWEAISRFYHPQPVNSFIIIVVAAIGTVINTLSALLFRSGQSKDLNIKAAFLHLVADAVISLGVVIGGLVIMKTGWILIDPAISLVVSLIILVGTWDLLRSSFRLAIDAVPDHIDMAQIKEYLQNLDSVVQLHDLHVWALSTTETALSVHLVITDNLIKNDFLQKIQKHLHDNFEIEHATIQLETELDAPMHHHDPSCT